MSKMFYRVSNIGLWKLNRSGYGGWKRPFSRWDFITLLVHSIIIHNFSTNEVEVSVLMIYRRLQTTFFDSQQHTTFFYMFYYLIYYALALRNVSSVWVYCPTCCSLKINCSIWIALNENLVGFKTHSFLKK